jgi:hypothetical protein
MRTFVIAPIRLALPQIGNPTDTRTDTDFEAEISQLSVIE